MKAHTTERGAQHKAQGCTLALLFAAAAAAEGQQRFPAQMPMAPNFLLGCSPSVPSRHKAKDLPTDLQKCRTAAGMTNLSGQNRSIKAYFSNATL